jgi:hypothetical protein
MHTFWHRGCATVGLVISSLALALPAAANPPIKERLPLTMSGAGCASKETEMNAVLQAIPGVTGVHFHRIPDHVLVDITPGAVKQAEVINRVNEAASSWQCKVEIIEGCISATMPSASAAPHQHE